MTIDGPLWIIRAERTEEGDHLRRFRFDELQVDRSEHAMFVSGGSRLDGVSMRCTKEVHSPIILQKATLRIAPPAMPVHARRHIDSRTGYAASFPRTASQWGSGAGASSAARKRVQKPTCDAAPWPNNNRGNAFFRYGRFRSARATGRKRLRPPG
jgi:hypothetical protein